MDCSHSHHAPMVAGDKATVNKLKLVLFLVAAYMVAEVIGGLLSGSLALLADAGHMISDVGAIGLALFAAWLASQPVSSQNTYGYHRIEILAALLNGVFLSLMSLWILYESFQRFWEPEAVEGGLMFWVALGGLLVNAASVWLLHRDKDQNLNVRGAYLHILGDLLGSVGAIIAAGLILQFGWTWADPVAGCLIAVLILFSAFRLIQEAVAVLLEGSPAHLDVGVIQETVLNLPGVQSVHDLHVWTIATQKEALSAHVTVDEAAFTPETITAIQHALKEQFGLSHVTIQIEPPGFEEDEIHF
ncbi:MAG: cation diffusion facilitator family transporter [Vampirovibrio sp.]|nr:cation diffusion facilitator family transporter [Vampirovibrio sp.]